MAQTASGGTARPGQDWDAGLYVERHGFVAAYGEAVVELLDPRPDERVLDLGCGPGPLFAALKARGATVVGVDAAPSMVERAKREHPDVEVHLATGAEFALGEFDAIFSNAALHWMLPPEPVVANVARSLKPGGRFVAEMGARGNVECMTEPLRDAIRERLGHAEPFPTYFPTMGEYMSLLEANGLEPAAAWVFDRPTPLAGPDGYRAWVGQFGQSLLESFSEQERDEVLARAEELARPRGWDGERWVADYRRLRFVAYRPE